jgi:hypothetical protein
MNFMFGGWEVAGAGMSLRDQSRFATQNPTDLAGQMKVNQTSLEKIQSGPLGSQIGMFGTLLADNIQSAKSAGGFRQTMLSINRNIPGVPGAMMRWGEKQLDTRNRVDEANAINSSDAVIDKMATGRRDLQASTRIGRVALAAMDPADAQRAAAEEEFKAVQRDDVKSRRTALGRVGVSTGQTKLELQEIAATLTAAQESRDTKIANIDRDVRERIRNNTSADETTGRAAALQGKGLTFAAQFDGILAGGQSDLRNSKSFEEGASALKRTADQLDGLFGGNARETGMALAKMGGQTLASSLGRGGDSLGSALAQINGQFMPQFTGGRLSGFNNLDRSNPMYQQQFQAQSQAYNEAKAAAFQNEAKREILQKGSLKSLDAMLLRDPLNAQQEMLKAERDAALEGVTDPKRRAEITQEFSVRDSLAAREFYENRDLRNMGMTGDIAETQMRFGTAGNRRGRPMAATALGIFNSAMEQNVAFANAGETDSARNALLGGQASLIGLKNQLENNPLFGSSIATSSPFAVDFTGADDKPPKEDMKAALQQTEQLLREIEKKL